MTFREAQELIEKYASLVGTNSQGHYVSMLIVAPNNHEHVYELIENSSNGLSSSLILQKYSDFDAVVIFDYDPEADGYFSKTSLTQFLQTRND